MGYLLWRIVKSLYDRTPRGRRVAYEREQERIPRLAVPVNMASMNEIFDAISNSPHVSRRRKARYAAARLTMEEIYGRDSGA